MKRTPEYIEGTEAVERFNALVSKVIAVPRSVIKEREAEYKRRSALKNNRPGPKLKVSVSPVHAVQPDA